MTGSVFVFFSFSTGLAKPIQVRKGFLASAQKHVAEIEDVLGLVQEKYLDNPVHWRTTTPGKKVTDAVYCKAVKEHNEWVRYLYEQLGEWSGKPPEDSETLTPEDAGGSLLRVLKFYQRGYRIPLDSMGAVLARLCKAVDWDLVKGQGTATSWEEQAAKVLTGLLREVDPNIDPDHIAHLPSTTDIGGDIDSESQEPAFEV